MMTLLSANPPVSPSTIDGAWALLPLTIFLIIMGLILWAAVFMYGLESEKTSQGMAMLLVVASAFTLVVLVGWALVRSDDIGPYRAKRRAEREARRKARTSAS